MLGVEPEALHRLGKCATTRPHASPAPLTLTIPKNLPEHRGRQGHQFTQPVSTRLGSKARQEKKLGFKNSINIRRKTLAFPTPTWCKGGVRVGDGGALLVQRIHQDFHIVSIYTD